MHNKLHFLGAAQNVTGSRYLIKANNVRFLVDCGLYQERKYIYRNWDPFPIPPNTLDAVLLTHAHLDHCGLLPKLVREGFRGRIVSTAATADITQIMLMDSAKIQEEDAEHKIKRHERERRKGLYPEVPLYTPADAKACCSLLSPVRYGEPVLIGNSVSATFHDAGHVLGSSMILVNIGQNGEKRSVLFSGDVGRWNKPILRDPTLFNEADYVLIESTYGDRLHEDSESVTNQLAEVINSTVQARGNIVVPSFALERSQEVLYYLNKLLMERRIPHLMVFLDSPMAVGITDIFEKHPELYDSDMLELIRKGSSPFDFPGLTMVRETDQSKAINNITGSTMIIAGSGMCTGGRVKHHLVTNISRPECTILFIGYQAIGTLGRLIVDGARKVRILGKEYPIRAKIAQINGFSAHADRDELFQWLSSLNRPPTQIFVVHGEPETALQFADFLTERTGWNISVPEYGNESILD
ncbi:MAG TPA: MBL fold metallo-hydrolase [Dehalococcoidia bacterium]|nr:MBL fold metallo-hydrolase [Dehalococcoidia bacterium]